MCICCLMRQWRKSRHTQTVRRDPLKKGETVRAPHNKQDTGRQSSVPNVTATFSDNTGQDCKRTNPVESPTRDPDHIDDTHHGSSASPRSTYRFRTYSSGYFKTRYPYSDYCTRVPSTISYSLARYLSSHSLHSYSHQSHRDDEENKQDTDDQSAFSNVTATISGNIGQGRKRTNPVESPTRDSDLINDARHGSATSPGATSWFRTYSSGYVRTRYPYSDYCTPVPSTISYSLARYLSSHTLHSYSHQPDRYEEDFVSSQPTSIYTYEKPVSVFSDVRSLTPEPATRPNYDVDASSDSTASETYIYTYPME